MAPAISVIMPCLNSAQHIGGSIASALGQTARDIELIVVDNGSSDGTLSIVRKIRDSRIRILRQPQRGVSAARNMGIAAARGEFVAFLDSDDTWRPDCLLKLRARLFESPDAVLAYCGWQNVGLPGARGEPFVPPEYETLGKRVALFADCRWPIHAALVRQKALMAVGGFDTSLTVGEDYLLWLEVASRGPIVRVPEVLAFYNFRQAGQATSNRIQAALDLLRAQEKYLALHPEFQVELGRTRARNLMLSALLARGFDCYWKRDLHCARAIFRRVLKERFGTFKDLKYLLPALLPYPMHELLVKLADRTLSEAKGRFGPTPPG
jgi:glycosyltransferase involved in cell wall biosynthesis